MLLAVPIPLFVSLKTSWKCKLRLYVLFALSIFIVAITIIRLPINSIHKDSQVNQTTWASAKLLKATIVVNAPTIHGLWNKTNQDSAYVHSYKTGQPSHHSQENVTLPRSFNDDFTTQAFLLGSINHKRDSPLGEILQMQETIVTEYIKPKENAQEGSRRLNEVEVASNSSQRGILRD